MVDVTFPFIVLLGGLVVGVVTARVRGHTGRRKAADILSCRDMRPDRHVGLGKRRPPPLRPHAR